MFRSKSFAVAVALFFVAAVQVDLAASLTAPLVDTGLTASTPSPDPDLVVVRERYYGAQGVDLTPYGIGNGSDTFVQSVYFRLYPQNTPGQESAVVGTVTFPKGVTILGFITNSTWLGSSTPGTPYTQSDALFAVAASPSDYESPSRGLEGSSGAGAQEYICQIDERSFSFALDVLGGGTDDFRVIIDYGNSFPPDQSFEVNLTQDKLGTIPGSLGIRVGATGGPTPGAGDYGEITHLSQEPLTTDIPPVTGSTPVVSGGDVLYLVRETTGDPMIDGIDIRSGAMIPGMLTIPPPFLQPPRAITFGIDGLLYAVGNQTGLAAVNTTTGSATNIGMPDLPGLVQRMTSVPGDSRLFILRQTSFPDPEDAWIDTYDIDTGVFTPNFATFPTDLLPNPVDLIPGTSGVIYALGIGNAFHAVNIFTGAVTPFAFNIPNLDGDNVRGTPDPFDGKVYILRDTTGPTFVDSLDLSTGTFQEAVFTIPASVIPDVGAMVIDSDAKLWVFGKNGGSMRFDPAAPAAPPLFQTVCLDFPGTTNYAAVMRTPREVSSGTSAQPLQVEVSSQPGSLHLSWEDLRDPSMVYNVYTGTLGSYYSHSSTACFLPPVHGAPGYLVTDLPTPSGNVYFLVTASTLAGEGPIAPKPFPPPSPMCGAEP